MPYTFCHPAYLLSLKHRHITISYYAIIIGSIVPDFDILFRLTDTRIHIFSFNVKDVLLYILPLSITLWCYMEWVIHPILKNLGFINSERMTIDAKTVLVNILVLLVAILLHLFLDFISHWDAFLIQSIIYANTGNYILSYFFYYYALYGNVIIISFIGLILLLKHIKSNADVRNSILQFLYNHHTKAITLLTFSIALFLFIPKYYIAKKEHSFFIDIIIINATGVFILACFISPVIYFWGLKIINKSRPTLL